MHPNYSKKKTSGRALSFSARSTHSFNTQYKPNDSLGQHHFGKPSFSESVRSMSIHKDVKIDNLYYTRVFRKQLPWSVTNKKFQRIIPKVLPLGTVVTLNEQRAKSNNWNIKRLQNLSNDVYLRHLVLPAQRVNERAYSYGIADWIEAAPIENMYQCQATDTRSPIERILIGLHKDAQISLMALLRSGVNKQVCRTLSGYKQPTISLAYLPEPPNGHVYNFAERAGTDLRSRASLLVRCDNEPDINRLRTFMASIHELSPLPTELIEFWDDIMNQADQKIEQCQQIVQLNARKQALPQPLSEQQHSELKTDSERLKQSLSWMPLLQPEKGIMDNKFTGYPNHVADYIECQGIYTYAPEPICHFPEGIPAIHQLILTNNIKSLRELIELNPVSIFQRDPWGYLPIEIALHLHDLPMATMIYETWEQLPAKQQWATPSFVKAANDIMFLENQCILGLDSEVRLKKVDAYFNDMLPGVPDPLIAYQCVEKNNWQQYQDQINNKLLFWQELWKLYQARDTFSIKQKIATLLPQRQAMFKAIIVEDWGALKESINDYFPSVSILEKAINDQDWEQVNQLVSHPVFQAETSLLEAVRQKNAEKASTLCKNFPKKWWRLTLDHHILREYRYAQFLKKALRKIVSGDITQEIKKKVIDFIKEEIAILYKIHKIIQEKDLQQIKTIDEKFCTQRGFFRTSFVSNEEDLLRLHEEIFVSSIVPEFFALYAAVFNADWRLVEECITNEISKLEQATKQFQSQQELKILLNQHLPVRSEVHRQALRGDTAGMQQMVQEAKEFDNFYNTVYTIQLQASIEINALIKHIPPQLANYKYYRTENIAYTLTELLKILYEKIVVNYDDLDDLQKLFSELKYDVIDRNANVNIESFASYFSEIYEAKKTAMLKIQNAIIEYYAKCYYQSEEDFSIFTHLVVAYRGVDAIKFLNSSSQCDGVVPVNKMLHRMSKQATKMQMQRYAALMRGFSENRRDMLTLAQSGLVSYGAQDPWGYTPLLLAVSNNQLAYVRAYFESGLPATEKIKTRHEGSNGVYYSLINHAITPEMTKLLLYYFCDPSDKSAILSQVDPNSLYIALSYGRHLLQYDYQRINIIDRIILGKSHFEKPGEVLKTLLYFVDDYIHVPTDDNVSEDIVAMILQHNKKIERKEKSYQYSPKINNLQLEEANTSIRSEFIAINESQEIKRYFSVIKKVNALSQAEQLACTKIFASQFRKNNGDSSQDPETLFLHKVLKNPQYYFDIYYAQNAQGNEQVMGFFCYKLFEHNDANYGAFAVLYASIIAVDPKYSQSNLLASSFKILAVVKKRYDSRGMPVIFYGRFASSGFAFLLVPKNAKVSHQYAIDDKLVQIVAQLVGDALSPEGWSIPPVIPVEQRSGYSSRFFVFDNLKKDCNMPANASLPLVFYVDQNNIEALLIKLSRANGINEAHINELTEAFSILEQHDRSLDNTTQANIGMYCLGALFCLQKLWCHTISFMIMQWLKDTESSAGAEQKTSSKDLLNSAATFKLPSHKRSQCEGYNLEKSGVANRPNPTPKKKL